MALVFGAKKEAGQLMQYCRVNLVQGLYQSIHHWKYLNVVESDIEELNSIYKRYCEYKKFSSVMPIFNSEYLDSSIEKIGYFHEDRLIAFSLVKIFDSENAELMQFAWTYQNPKMRLGIKSLENECAIYKDRGFKHLYLGEYHNYKRFLQGFEMLGTL